MKNIVKIIREEIINLKEEFSGRKLYGYHCTPCKNVESIERTGFKVGPRDMQGVGVYAFYNLTDDSSGNAAVGYGQRHVSEEEFCIVKFEIRYPDWLMILIKSIAEDVFGNNADILKQIENQYTGGWDVCTPEMVAYGEQDVEVLEAIFNYYKPQIMDPAWAKAMRVEHDMAIICHDMSTNGFYFDETKAKELLDSIQTEMKEIEDNFATTYPPKLVEVNRIKHRQKADGSLYKNVEDAMTKYPMTRVEGDELVCFDYEPFNPASPKHRIDVLWDAGWKPTQKTKGHKKFEKESRRA